jgi:5-oxoprolinase (ATP-hydrolysing)
MLKEISKKIEKIENGLHIVEAKELMDDGSELRLKLSIDSENGYACFDFTGTDPEMYGNCNAPKSITSSAIIYCLRCLVD